MLVSIDNLSRNALYLIVYIFREKSPIGQVYKSPIDVNATAISVPKSTFRRAIRG